MRQIKQLLKQTKIDSLDAERLLAHALKKSREFVLAHPENSITKKQDTRYKELIQQRQRSVPLAYLTGHKEFFGLDFIVNKYVLIPRPETEILVESVLAQIKNQKNCPACPELCFGELAEGSEIKNQKIILIDVGTGTGCIPIAIIKTLKQNNRTTPIVYATDISKPALAVARRNAKRHNVKIKFLCGNLLKPIINNVTMWQCNNVIITANLPYLTKQQYKNEPSIHYEPKSALVAKKNGLKLYQELLKQIQSLVTGYPASGGTPPEGGGSLRLTAFLEINPSQTEKIIKLIHQYLPLAKVEIKKDLAGQERVVKIYTKLLF